MLNKSLEALKKELETPEGKAQLQKFWDKLTECKDNARRHAKKINEFLNTLSDDELDILASKFILWERKYEEREYKKGLLTQSNILTQLDEMFLNYGKETDDDEDFLGSSYIYINFIISVYIWVKDHSLRYSKVMNVYSPQPKINTKHGH